MKHWLLIAVAIAGCSGKGGGAQGDGTKTFTIEAPALDDPRPTVKVSVKIPASWKYETEKDGAPRFELPGGSSFMGPTIVFLTPAGDDDAGRMKTTIGLQYDDTDLAAAKREDVSGGRVWIAHTRDNGYVHARLFIPAPAQKGVVMCVAMLTAEEAKQLPAVRSMCESIAITGA